MSIEAMKIIAGLAADNVIDKKEEEILRQSIADAKNKWVGLDHDEVVERANQEQYAAAFARGVVWAEAKLKEENT